MVNNAWAGTKIRLRAITSGGFWERFHDNDEDSDGAGGVMSSIFLRSEEGTKALDGAGGSGRAGG